MLFFPKKIKEEVMFMNRSVNYFAKNDQFEETNLNEVLTIQVPGI
jgi:hypothetical protein